MKVLLPLLLLTLSLQTAIAADVVGNGGDAIICKNGDSELLDLYEARTLRGIQFDPSLQAPTPEEIVYRALDRLSRLDSRRARDYREKTRLFRQEARFIPNANLVDVPDSREIALPRDCELKQVAIQRKPEFPEDNRYLIDKTVWDALPVRDQAALIMHEILYGEAIERGHLDSVRVRYFNSNLLSPRILEIDSEGYTSMLRFSGFLNFISTIDNLLFAMPQYGIEKVDIALGRKVCKREGRDLLELYNDSYFGTIYPSFGTRLRIEFGFDSEGQIYAAYIGTNGFGQRRIVSTEFNTERSIFRGILGAHQFLICK